MPGPRQLVSAPPAVKAFERGPFPGVELVPWNDDATAILGQLSAHVFTPEEIEAVRRVHLWLQAEGPLPEPAPVRAPPPEIRERVRTLTTPRSSTRIGGRIDPDDLGD